MADGLAWADGRDLSDRATLVGVAAWLAAAGLRPPLVRARPLPARPPASPLADAVAAAAAAGSAGTTGARGTWPWPMP